MTAFYRRGKTQVWFAPTMTSIVAPAIADINAGTELSPAVAGITGFSYKNTPILTPVLSSAWENQIPGSDAADPSSLEFYEDDTTNPLRTTLAKGTKGFIVILPFGLGSGAIVAAKKVDVFPVQVSGIPRVYSLANDAAKWMAEFTITTPPTSDVATV